MNTDKIFVTGGTGLLGSYLLKLLVEQGKYPKALCRTAPSKFLTEEENKNVEWIKGDVLDVNLLNDVMKNIDQVYHAAAIVTFHPSRIKELFKVNIEGTANVVNAALDNGIKKMVHVSSVSALGRLHQQKPIDENVTWTPRTNSSRYGETKYLAELEVWRGIAEGLRAVIVNPTVILGAGNWEQGSAKIFKTAYEEFPWYSEGAGGFVDARDVAVIMTQLMESKITGERFIVNGSHMGFREVLNLIAKEFGKKPPHKKANKFLAGLIWKMESVKLIFSKHEPLLTKESARIATIKVSFDTSKLKKYFPLFEFTPIEQTIHNTCQELIKIYAL